MTYDDWKTTDPNDALYCENGHYMCPHRCPVCKGCVDSCDCMRCRNEMHDDDCQDGCDSLAPDTVVEVASFRAWVT